MIFNIFIFPTGISEVSVTLVKDDSGLPIIVKLLELKSNNPLWPVPRRNSLHAKFELRIGLFRVFFRKIKVLRRDYRVDLALALSTRECRSLD